MYEGKGLLLSDSPEYETSEGEKCRRTVMILKVIESPYFDQVRIHFETSHQRYISDRPEVI